MDEARLGQQGTLTRVWARAGSRPSAGVSAIDQALCAEGFIVTPVASEDGPYAVVAWWPRA